MCTGMAAQEVLGSSVVEGRRDDGKGGEGKEGRRGENSPSKFTNPSVRVQGGGDQTQSTIPGTCPGDKMSTSV